MGKGSMRFLCFFVCFYHHKLDSVIVVIAMFFRVNRSRDGKVIFIFFWGGGRGVGLF